MKTRVFDWIETEWNPRRCPSESFIYDDMESQSYRCLPILYQPFDPDKKGHWCDRGACWDFYHTTGGGGRLLDFGPGDGWPSLIVAPFVGAVVGIDSSLRRVEVCRNNGRRLGIGNASFYHVPSTEPLPFPTGSFDGAMAASSIEQSPDPKGALRELCRILKPGGRLRISYEALGPYRDGGEREMGLHIIDANTCLLLTCDRDIDGEEATQYALRLSLPAAEVRKRVPEVETPSRIDVDTGDRLRSLRESVTDVRVCKLRHPSGPTLASWLDEVGFSEIHPSLNGMDHAGRLFDALPEGQRPSDLEGVDKLVRPEVEKVVARAADIHADPMITAVK